MSICCRRGNGSRPGPNEFRVLVAGVIELLEVGQTEAGLRQFVETVIIGPGACEQLPQEVRQTVIFNAPGFREETWDPSLHSFDLQTLRRYSGPVLLSSGEDGPPIFWAIIERLAQALPQGERKVFLGAGHKPEYTQSSA